MSNLIRRYGLVLCCVILWLPFASCVAAGETRETPTFPPTSLPTIMPDPSPQATQTPAVTSTQTALPTASPSPLPTATPAPRVFEVYLEEGKPSDPGWQGTLIGEDALRKQKVLIELPQGEQIPLPGYAPMSELLGIYATSPDRGRFAYRDYTPEKNTEIRGIRGDGRVVDMPNLPGERSWNVIDWLDNERLALAEADRRDGTVFVYDITNGELTELAPFFPMTTQHGELHYITYLPVPYVYYDPSLTRVVIVRSLAGAPPKMHYELWDTTTQTLLWEESGSNVGSSHRPVWSPDGQTLALVIGPYVLPGEENGCGRLYLIDRTGEQVQLDPCVWVAASWSPDGRYLATWLMGQGDLCPIPYHTTVLVTLEVETGAQTRYALCQSGEGAIFVSQFPIWSPDGRFIAFNQYDIQLLPVGGIILDLGNAKAYDFPGVVEINGWIKSSPES